MSNGDDIDDLEKLFNEIRIDESTVTAPSKNAAAVTANRLSGMVEQLRKWSTMCRVGCAFQENGWMVGDDQVQQQLMSDLQSVQPPGNLHGLLQEYNRCLVEAMADLRQFLTESPPPIDAVLDTGIWSLVAYYIERPFPTLGFPLNSPRLMYEASWVILNLFSGNENQVYKVAANTTIIQSLLKIAGFCRLAVAEHLGSTVGSPSNLGVSFASDEFVSLFTREHVLWALGNVAGTNHVFRMTLLVRGFGPKLMKELHGVWETIRAAHCFSNGSRFPPPIALYQPLTPFNYFASHPCAVDEEFREGVVKFPVFNVADTSIHGPEYGPPQTARPLAFREIHSLRSMSFIDSHGRLPEDNVLEVVQGEEEEEQAAKSDVMSNLQDFKAGACLRLDSIVGNFVWSLTNLIRPLDMTDSSFLVDVTSPAGETPDQLEQLRAKVMGGLRLDGHAGPEKAFPPIEDIAPFLSSFHALSFLNSPEAYGETLWGICFALSGFKLRVTKEVSSLSDEGARTQCQAALLNAMSPFLSTVVDAVCVISQRLLTFRWASKRRNLLHYFCPAAQRQLVTADNVDREYGSIVFTASLVDWDQFGSIKQRLEVTDNVVPSPNNPARRHYLLHPSWEHPILSWSVVPPAPLAPHSSEGDGELLRFTPVHTRTMRVLEDVLYYRTEPVHSLSMDIGKESDLFVTPMEASLNTCNGAADAHDIHNMVDATLFHLTGLFQIASPTENVADSRHSGSLESIGMGERLFCFPKETVAMARDVWCGVLRQSFECASRRYSQAQQRRSQWIEHYSVYQRCLANPTMMQQAMEANPNLDPTFNLFSVLPDELQQEVWKEEMPGNVLAMLALSLTRVGIACRKEDDMSAHVLSVDPNAKPQLLGPQLPRSRSMYMLWSLCSNPYVAFAVRQPWVTRTYSTMLSPSSVSAQLFTSVLFNSAFEFICTVGLDVPNRACLAIEASFLAAAKASVLLNFRDLVQFIDVFATACRRTFLLDANGNELFQISQKENLGTCWQSRSQHLHFISRYPSVCRSICLVAIGMCCELQAWCEVAGPERVADLSGYLMRRSGTSAPADGHDSVFISTVTFPFVDVAVVPLPFDGEEFLSSLVTFATMEGRPCDISRSGPQGLTGSIQPTPFEASKMVLASPSDIPTTEPPTFDTSSYPADPTRGLTVLTFEDIYQCAAVLSKMGEYAQSVLGELKESIINSPVEFYRSQVPLEFQNSHPEEFQAQQAFEMAGHTVRVYDLLGDVLPRTLRGIGLSA